MVYDIDSIKQQNPIEHVVGKRGIVLHDSGAHLVGLCPFHEDEHPSLCVYPETRSFYCFGCNAGGDVIDFVRRADNLSFRDALERLSNGQTPTPSNPTRPETLSLDDRMILTAATAIYHETLLRTPTALRYLEARGVGMSLSDAAGSVTATDGHFDHTSSGIASACGGRLRWGCSGRRAAAARRWPAG